MDNRFSSHCFLRKNRLNRKGFAPIFLSITVNGKRAVLTTKQSAELDRWNSSTGRVKGYKEDARIINEYLENYENHAKKEFNKLVIENKYFDVIQLKNRIEGIDSSSKTLLEVFQENNAIMKAEIGVSFAENTVKRYEISLTRMKSFLENELKITDIILDSLDYHFIKHYETYLKTICDCSHNTTMKYIKELKRVIHQAMKFNYIKVDPFKDFKVSYKEVNRGYLTESEINVIESKIFKIERLNVVKDIFLFICYTGLSYSDFAKLTPKHIVENSDGFNWIVTERKKTGVRFSIPLLPKAETILEKYKNHPECQINGTLLPLRSNQKLNSYLTEIADLCGIDKNITCHIGRHTFATTVTLTKGIPIETVSKMLGHKDLSTTSIYSKVINKKIAEDMAKIAS